MKHIKLLIISAVAFYCLFWGFTMLFPGTTVVSRVVNIPMVKDSMMGQLENGSRTGFYGQWLTWGAASGVSIETAPNSFYPNNLFNGEAQAGADTVFFKISKNGKSDIVGGVALYDFSEDSTLTQLFYVFNTPWYKPWEKLATMMNDKRFGNGMEAALNRLKGWSTNRP